MGSRKERENFDALTARIFLVLIGISFAAAAYFLSQWNDETARLATVIAPAFATGGIGIIICGLVVSGKNAVSLSEKTGNSELLILHILLAMGLAALIRQIRNKKEKSRP